MTDIYSVKNVATMKIVADGFDNSVNFNDSEWENMINVSVMSQKCFELCNKYNVYMHELYYILREKN